MNPPSFISNRFRSFLLSGILTAAFALRVIYILQIQSSPFFDPQNAGLDPSLYDTWAQQISSGDWLGKEVFKAAPFYPYFLGALYKVFGRNLLWIGVVQAIIGTLSCFLIYRISARVFGGVSALVTAALAGGYQMFVFHDAMFISSNAGIFLNALGLYVTLIAVDKSDRKWYAVSGLILGVAMLATVSVMGFIVLTVLWLAVRKRQLRAGLIFLMGVMATVLPVTLRNIAVGHDFVPMTAHGGINFYIGNNPSATGVFHPPEFMMGSSSGLLKDSETFAEKEEGRRLKPSEVSRFWFNKGLRFIQDHPRGYATLMARKAGLILNAAEVTDILNVNLMAKDAPVLKWLWGRFWWIFPLAVVGIVASWPLTGDRALIAIFALGHMFSVCLYFVNARYRLPMVIAALIFAGYGIVWMIDSFRQRKFTATLWRALGAIAIGAVTFLPLYHQDATVDVYNVAMAYLKQGKIQESEQMLKESLKMNPRFADGYYALGYLYWQQGRGDEAILNYQKAVEIRPGFAEALHNLGLMYLNRQELEKARHFVMEAISIKPDYKDALVTMAMISSQEGDRFNEKKWWGRVLQVDPGHAMGLQRYHFLSMDGK